jgi:DNA-binding beta-propeller fold protein YncE
VIARYVELIALDNYGSDQHVAVAEFEVVATNTAFNHPTGLALDSLGTLYVADTGNNRIQKVSPHGKLLHIWGTKGSGKGQFRSPRGVAIAGNGHVLVADTLNHRLQEFSLVGQFLRSLGTEAQLGSPTAIAADARGTIYVGDSSGRRIHHPATPPVRRTLSSGWSGISTLPPGVVPAHRSIVDASRRRWIGVGASASALPPHHPPR